ncbi:LysR substrate-binding domain-containing protein [Gallibacterium melopsittaci]|uniref:LysR substrate-binding domain-containing protein n=1 Tax=Gallibacterium melopsittaci TaxID=516063 RepID=A0ABV6HUZ5_9PAST
MRADLTPLMQDIHQAINNLAEYHGSLRGSLRINGTESAFFCLWHKLQRFMDQYPEVKLELTSEIRFVDIVAERFDMGIRLGEDVSKDMIAVRISPDMPMAVVSSPDYFVRHGKPETPADLIHHQTIALRLPTHGGLLAWEFRDKNHSDKIIKVQPNDRFVTNTTALFSQLATSGRGLIWTMLEHVKDDIQSGRLVEVLQDWRMVYQGYHLYYPNRRTNDALFSAFVETMRYEGEE